eukprot:jgi/Hompol1/4898/HPOL_004008-RA
MLDYLFGSQTSPTPLTKLPDSIELTEPGTGRKLLIGELLDDGKPCLFLVVRRPGCLLCREQAGELLKYRNIIQRCGLNLVAVLKEQLGADEFAANHWKEDPVLIDEAKELYKIVGIVTAGIGTPNNNDSGGSLKSASILNRAGKRGYEGNIQGEGFIYGGLLIVSADRSITYQYAEKEWGDHAPLADVIAACKTYASPAVHEEIDALKLDFSNTNAANKDGTACDASADACKL